MSDDRSHDDRLAQVARTEVNWAQAVARSAILDCGLALFSPGYARLAEVNQVREVALEGKVSIAPADAFEEVARFFAARGLTPLRWTSAIRLMGSAEVGLGEYLESRGYGRRAWRAMVRDSAVRIEIDESIQLLGARAAPKGYAALQAERFGGDPLGGQKAALAQAHLGDSRLEMLVARIDGEPAGCGGVLSVGDIGRVRGLYVARGFADRRDQIARTLLGHLLELGYRYQFGTICTLLADEDERERALFEACGFVSAGELISYEKAPG